MRRYLPWGKFTRQAGDVAGRVWAEATGAGGKGVLVVAGPRPMVVRPFRGYLGVSVGFFDGRVRQSLEIGHGLAYHSGDGFELAGAVTGLAVLADAMQDPARAAKLGLLSVGNFADGPLREQSAWNRPLMTLTGLYSRPNPPELLPLLSRKGGPWSETVQDHRISIESYEVEANVAAVPLGMELGRLLAGLGL